MQKFLSLKTQLHRISGEYCHHSKNILSYFYCFSLSAFLFLHTSSLLLHQKSRPYSTYRGGKVGLKFTVSFLRFQNVKQTQQKLAQARGFLSFVFSFPSYRVPCVTLSPKLVFCQPGPVSLLSILARIQLKTKVPVL